MDNIPPRKVLCYFRGSNFVRNCNIQGYVFVAYIIRGTLLFGSLMGNWKRHMPRLHYQLRKKHGTLNRYRWTKVKIFLVSILEDVYVDVLCNFTIDLDKLSDDKIGCRQLIIEVLMVAGYLWCCHCEQFIMTNLSLAGPMLRQCEWYIYWFAFFLIWCIVCVDCRFWLILRHICNKRITFLTGK